MSTSLDRRADSPDPEGDLADGYVTAWVGDQLIGIAMREVGDVFVPKSICPIPLAPPHIAGLLNLRGRVVTLIDLRRCLGLAARPEGTGCIAIGIERGSELYGLTADRIGDVLRPLPESFEPLPVNLGQTWSNIASGVHRLERGIMVVLCPERVLRHGRRDKAAEIAAGVRT